jgi:hypothetical protein
MLVKYEYCCRRTNSFLRGRVGVGVVLTSVILLVVDIPAVVAEEVSSNGDRIAAN